MTTLLEKARAMIEGRVPPPPVSATVGFAMTEIEPGRAVITLEAGPQHANPMGSLHGGVLCDIADAAMGMAWAATLAEGETFTTLDLHMRFLRPFWSGKLTAVGKVVHSGRTLGVVECDVTDEKGRVIATATSSCLTLRGEQAKGR